MLSLKTTTVNALFGYLPAIVKISCFLFWGDAVTNVSLFKVNKESVKTLKCNVVLRCYSIKYSETIQMTRDQLRHEVERFAVSKSIVDNKEMLAIFSEFMITVIHQQKFELELNRLDNEARLIFQMMFTKTLSLNNLLNGVGFEGGSASLNNIIDPTVIRILVRNVFETAAMFNLIYRSPKSEDEKKILHSLWVLSGLAYRQRFESSIRSEETRKKWEFEKQEISRLTSEIEETDLYKSLEVRDQEKIQNRIKQKST